MAERQVRGECGTRIGRGVINWPCHLEVGHDGPHAAREDAPSMAARARWEQSQTEEAREARAIMEESQGRPVTFWEHRGEDGGGLPHPGQVREERFQERMEPTIKPVESTQAPPPAVPVIVEEDRHCPKCGHENGVLRNVLVTDPQTNITVDAIACEQCGNYYTASQTIRPAPEPPTFEPTKQRPGDQPLPQTNDLPSIQDLVIGDIEARKAVGIERYGTTLQPFNGRDSALDAYEEALDLAVYLRQVRYEHSVIAGRLRELAENLGAIRPQEGSRVLKEMADVLDPPRGG